MRFIKAEDYERMCWMAASIIGGQIINKPDCVLGLATGSTPIGIYANLVKACKSGELDFSEVSCFNLDEYIGVARDDVQSYYYYMQEHLFNHVNIAAANTHIPDGMAADAAAACDDYERRISAVGGVDMQLLGMGHNGHIGFNEPGTEFTQKTSMVTLAQTTIEANKRFFSSPDDVPRQALTMGIGTIMAARKVLVAVSGKDKAAVVKEAFFGPVLPAMPASILQFHPDVTVVGDEAAFSLLPTAKKL